MLRKYVVCYLHSSCCFAVINKCWFSFDATVTSMKLQLLWFHLLDSLAHTFNKSMQGFFQGMILRLSQNHKKTNFNFNGF